MDPASGDVYMVVCDHGIWRSRDGGKSWEKVSDAKPAAPVMSVRKGVGCWMTETGKLAEGLPPGFGVGLVGPNYACDSERDVFYASSMGKHAYRFER